MRYSTSRIMRNLAVMAAVIGVMAGAHSLRSGEDVQMETLIPPISQWSQDEQTQSFYPETLFEYINGAAEIYLSYEFKQLLVAQFKKGDTEKAMAIEIYDMGSVKNAFGIYSAERYPENAFLDIGIQGYVEEGSLNFLAGKYYVKLLCFECEEESEDSLKTFAGGIVARITDTGNFPGVLAAFPDEGMVANTEKFILRNFMGYGFLHDGYLANYAAQGLEFDAFIIEGRDAGDAEDMLRKYLEQKGTAGTDKATGAYRIEDKYYHNIYIVRVENYLCGVMKIKDGWEKLGETYLSRLVKNIKSLTG